MAASNNKQIQYLYLEQRRTDLLRDLEGSLILIDKVNDAYLETGQLRFCAFAKQLNDNVNTIRAALQEIAWQQRTIRDNLPLNIVQRLNSSRVESDRQTKI